MVSSVTERSALGNRLEKIDGDLHEEEVHPFLVGEGSHVRRKAREVAEVARVVLQP
jgi:hypothetical protein